jgi:hypothetical protein
MDIEENTIGNLYQAPNGEEEASFTPVMLYSIGLNADELLTGYAALRTYLKVLASQENEDFEQIQSAAKLLISLKSRAVRASKEVSLRAVGIDSGSSSV